MKVMDEARNGSKADSQNKVVDMQAGDATLDSSAKAYIENNMEIDDPVRTLEEQLLREASLVFDAPDICNIGDAEPLFSNFAFEDWAMMALRFEIHLLVHAFMRDSKVGSLATEQLAFYYNKYYNKMLTPSSYGVRGLYEVLHLIDDTVVSVDRVLESQLTDELHSNDIFVRLAEENRQVRQRRIDLGDKSAILRLQLNRQSSSSAPPRIVHPPTTAGNLGIPAGPLVPPPRPGANQLPLWSLPVEGGAPPTVVGIQASTGVGLQSMPRPRGPPAAAAAAVGGMDAGAPYGACDGSTGGSKSRPYPDWKSGQGWHTGGGWT